MKTHKLQTPPTKISILGVDFGDPWDVATFSGSSRYIWTELKSQKALVDVFTPYPGRLVTAFYKLLSFRPTIRKWRANWRRSVAFKNHLSRKAGRAVQKREHASFNVILQIGAYYDLSKSFMGMKVLLADNNCAITQRTNITFQSSRTAYERQYAFEKRVYQSMDLVFCFSKYLADSMVRDFGCDSSKVKVVYAGINLDEALIASDTKDYNSRTILFSGFNFENKGGRVLLEAFNHVREEIPDAKLLLLGPTVGGLPEGVTNHGPLSKSDARQLETIATAYRQASVLALPTLADAFPNVIREGMAAGLPCVASNIGSIPEMVKEGVTGFLVPARNSALLAERLLTLLRDPDLCCKMGRAGYDRYRKLFTWEAVCGKILDEIGQMMEDKGTF